jgi:hypothetical protein
MGGGIRRKNEILECLEVIEEKGRKLFFKGCDRGFWGWPLPE